MPANLGTRVRQGAPNNTMESGSDTRSRNQDAGMTKRIVASVTFTAADGRVTAANGTFANTFALDDPLLAEGASLNNGFFVITGLDGASDAYLVLDPPPKDEGPLTVTLRTP